MHSRIIICTITHTCIACKVGRRREGGGGGGREGEEEKREGEREGGRETGREGKGEGGKGRGRGRKEGEKERGRQRGREGEWERGGKEGGREGGRVTSLYQKQLDEKRTPSHTSLLLLFHLVSHSLSTHAYQSIWQHSTCVCIKINDKSVLAIMPSIAELSSQ